MSHIKTVRPSSDVSTSPFYIQPAYVDMFKQIEGMAEVKVAIPYLDNLISSNSSYSAFVYSVFKCKDYDIYFTIFGDPSTSPSPSSSVKQVYVYCFIAGKPNDSPDSIIMQYNINGYIMYDTDNCYGTKSKISYCILSDMICVSCYTSTNNFYMFIIWKENGYTCAYADSSSSMPSKIRISNGDYFTTISINPLDSSNKNRGLIFPLVWSVLSPEYNLYSLKLKQCYSSLITSANPMAKLTINGEDYIHLTGPLFIPYTEPASTSTSTSTSE